MQFEILKENIYTIFSLTGYIPFKLIAILILVIVYIIPYFIFKRYDIVLFVQIIFTICFIVIVEYKFKTNINLTEDILDIPHFLENAKTGDLVLYRSYHSYDVPEFIFFRMFASLFTTTYFGHIGMVVKIKNKIYILESALDKCYSILTNTVKNGVILTPAEDRIIHYTGRVHYIKTNIHEFITEKELINYIFKKRLHTKSFFEDSLSCVNLIIRVLLNFKLFRRDKISILTPGSFIEPHNYTNKVKLEKIYIIKN